MRIGWERYYRAVVYRINGEIRVGVRGEVGVGEEHNFVSDT